MMSTRSERPNPDVPHQEILASSDVWDMMVPWMPIFQDINILRRYKQAGYTFVSLTLQDWPPTLDGMTTCIDRFKEVAKEESDWLVLGYTLADIDKGRREGKLVVGINSQETRPIGEDLTRIEAMRTLGVRHMLLAYNVRNLVADGCAETADAGLSNFGRRVVREMNRVGILVDCSHTGRRSSLDAIEISERPAIFSHSGAYAIYPHIRNIHDDQIRSCAQRGGVIGVVGLGGFLGDANASSESLFRHIDYLASLVGPEHVGLGTDYVRAYPKKDHPEFWKNAASGKWWPDQENAWPEPTAPLIPRGESRSFAPEQISELAEIMLEHGYLREAITGILGGNFRRVYAMLPENTDA